MLTGPDRLRPRAVVEGVIASRCVSMRQGAIVHDLEQFPMRVQREVGQFVVALGLDAIGVSPSLVPAGSVDRLTTQVAEGASAVQDRVAEQILDKPAGPFL